MAETVTMPKLGFDMAEGTLVRWVKSEGETVNKGDVLAEIETDKATVEVESSFSVVVYRQLVEAGMVVPVNTPIAIIAAPGEHVTEDVKSPLSVGRTENVDKATAPVASPKVQAVLPVKVMEKVKASPLAKRMALESGISLEGITGSGPGGRIVKKDIEQAGAEITAARETVTPASAPVKSDFLPVPLSETWVGTTTTSRKDQIIPLTKLRSAIARRMVESKQAPHFYITHDFDMAGLMKLRKEVNEFLPEEDRISVNDFIIKAVALTLRQFPNINASFAGNEIVQHGAVNIGVAVALDVGLLTVVTHDADVKPLRVISSEIKAMAARARVGKVKSEDIEGSTFPSVTWVCLM